MYAKYSQVPRLTTIQRLGMCLQVHDGWLGIQNHENERTFVSPMVNVITHLQVATSNIHTSTCIRTQVLTYQVHTNFERFVFFLYTINKSRRRVSDSPSPTPRATILKAEEEPTGQTKNPLGNCKLTRFFSTFEPTA